MRRRCIPPEPAEALRQVAEMHKVGLGLKVLLPYLPPGASLEDARRLFRRLQQASRTPCSFLDDDLGISRE